MISRPRRGHFERLEDRLALAGVTLITHGFNSDVAGWVAEMADAIATHPDLSGIDPVRYTIEVTDPGHDGGPLSVMSSKDSGPELSDLQTDWPEIVLLLDWSDVAGTLSLGGGYTRNTTDVAAAVADKLMAEGFLEDLLSPAAELPLHLIGHSRGASLVGELSRQLGEKGIWVDHVTTLDPHPVDGFSEPLLFPFDFGDAPMTSWDSVLYWDNYWRTEGTASLDFTGESVTDALDIQLDETVLSSGGYGFEHSDVHLWYYGTIDQSTNPPANNGDHDVPSTWFGGSHPARDATGYYYSRLVGGAQDATGLSQFIAGSAERAETNLSNAEWANITDLKIDSEQFEFHTGEMIPLAFYFQLFADQGQEATVSVAIDPDRNPYNGNQIDLAQLTYSETGRSPIYETVNVSLENAVAGTYYLSTESTTASGRTRKTYSRAMFSIATNSFPSAVLNASDVSTHGGTSHSFTVSYSDDSAIVVASIDTGDVLVTGPNDFQATATLISVDNLVNGTPRTATYQFDAPGGSWDSNDNGTYSVAMNPNQVSDTDGNCVPQGTLGTFQASSPNRFVVNSTGDGGDLNPGDGIADDGTGNTTLRAAIEEANALPNTAVGPDVIVFDDAVESSLFTIRPESPLPAVTDSVIIDGTAEPDFSGTPVVELDGSSSGVGADGLVVKAGPSQIRGLAINRWNDVGIYLNGGGGHTLEGNFIGVDTTGSTVVGNKIGLYIKKSSNNQIGGLANVISGNAAEGIRIKGAAATGNVIRGNLIGTDSSGSIALPNKVGIGIYSGAGGNTIGGNATTGQGNVISGNTNEGVLIRDSNGNSLFGNLIGLNVTGTQTLGNGREGIEIYQSGNTVVGSTAQGHGNVISGNANAGILITKNGASGNLVQSNRIGTDADGENAIANRYGVQVVSAPLNTIGGANVGRGNLISGNRLSGVYLTNTDATGNLVQGNLIGTNASLTAAIPNKFGVDIRNAPNNLIGGTGGNEENTIAANKSVGIRIQKSSATGNQIQGNWIVFNREGLRVESNASNNVVGGLVPEAGNLIEFNAKRGVRIKAGTGNSILGNSMSRNGNLGIDLDALGITPNDADDTDVGPNNLQNSTEINSVTVNGANLHIAYTIPSLAAHSTFPLRVEFFIADVTGEEGQTFLGSHSYTTEGSTPTIVIPRGSANEGSEIVATATDADGNTSEFSIPVTVVESQQGANGVLPTSAESVKGSTPVLRRDGYRPTELNMFIGWLEAEERRKSVAAWLADAVFTQH